MKSNKRKNVLSIVAMAAVIGVLIIIGTAFAAEKTGEMKMMKKDAMEQAKGMMDANAAEPNALCMYKMHKCTMACTKQCEENIAQLDMAMESLKKAKTALDENNMAVAKDEIAKTEKILAEQKQKILECQKKMPSCSWKCPISGMKIDPTDMPESRIRMYKGKKIGFCSDACPAAWDKLTDAEKDAKLAELMHKKMKGEKAKSMMMEKGKKEMDKITY